MVLTLGWSWNEVSLGSPRSRSAWSKGSAELPALTHLSACSFPAGSGLGGTQQCWVNDWAQWSWRPFPTFTFLFLTFLNYISEKPPSLTQLAAWEFIEVFDYCIIHRKVLNNFWARFSSGGKGCGYQAGSSPVPEWPSQSHCCSWTMGDAALSFWSVQVVLPCIQKQLESSILHTYHLLAF